MADVNKNVIKTPMTDFGSPSCYPSGKATTDGKVGPDLPARTTGKNSEPEVTYDRNAGQ